MTNRKTKKDRGTASRWRKVEARFDDRHHIGSVVPDSKYPNMWRVRLGDGALTGMTNLSRAKDAAMAPAPTG